MGNPLIEVSKPQKALQFFNCGWHGPVGYSCDLILVHEPTGFDLAENFFELVVLGGDRYMGLVSGLSSMRVS